MQSSGGDAAPARILIRLPNWVGDVVMALPAVQALRAARPRAHLLAMARPPHVELVRRVAAFDDVAPAPAGGRRLGSWWRAVRRLRAARLDAAVLLAPSFESALTALAAGIPLRIGQRTDRRAPLLSHALAPAPGRPRGAGMLALVAVLGAGAAPGRPPFDLQAPERRRVERLFAGAGLPREARPVLVNPAAAKTPRAWSAERFRRLAETIAERHPGLPVLVHCHHPFVPPADWPRHPAIRNLRGLTLVELCAVIERCRLYVGNDSGPLHLAAALGVPTVGVYGPSSPAHTGPPDTPAAPHAAVSASFPCAPCRERFFKECPSPATADGRPPCLDAVALDGVLAAVERQLAAPPAIVPAAP